MLTEPCQMSYSYLRCSRDSLLISSSHSVILSSARTQHLRSLVRWRWQRIRRLETFFNLERQNDTIILTNRSYVRPLKLSISAKKKFSKKLPLSKASTHTKPHTFCTFMIYSIIINPNKNIYMPNLSSKEKQSPKNRSLLRCT